MLVLDSHEFTSAEDDWPCLVLITMLKYNSYKNPENVSLSIDLCTQLKHFITCRIVEIGRLHKTWSCCHSCNELCRQDTFARFLLRNENERNLNEPFAPFFGRFFSWACSWNYSPLTLETIRDLRLVIQVRSIRHICHFVDTSTIFNRHQKHTNSRLFDTEKHKIHDFYTKTH